MKSNLLALIILVLNFHLNAQCWKSIKSGGNQTSAIRTDGTLWLWGSNFYGQIGNGTSTLQNTPIQVGTTNNWDKIANGGDHLIAIKQDGSLWTWGRNNFGQLGK